eukprot:CAMPEP_0117678972 /NCGR_PEP_ID=MMETSP0804-20121206/17578_1 /TAXON_ID=1074897 /ORGANISM="Tetraselmis astigmatica, Strain CCMP880" /LENGTH=420 /DNA_ID=CAMNT_0005488387 /DNA_START=67 /DNA_END=1329 /DNA_ORIENTATION=+
MRSSRGGAVRLLLKFLALSLAGSLLYFAGFQRGFISCRTRVGDAQDRLGGVEGELRKLPDEWTAVDKWLATWQHGRQQEAKGEQEHRWPQQRGARQAWFEAGQGSLKHSSSQRLVNRKHPEEQDEVMGSRLPETSHFAPGLRQAQQGQDTIIYEHHFRSRPELMKQGVFVEFGGRDGVEHSNTYFYEMALGWRGIMVEADVREYPGLPGNRPNTVPVFGALTAEDGGSIKFLVSKFGGLSGFADQVNRHRLGNVMCPCASIDVPTHNLNTILDRAGIRHVNYMTVDTEGSELSILKTIDFSRVYIELVQVEVLEIQETRTEDIAKRLAVVAFMESVGFRNVETLVIADDTQDLVFQNQAPVPPELSQEKNDLPKHKEAVQRYTLQGQQGLALARQAITGSDIKIPPVAARKQLRKNFRRL